MLFDDIFYPDNPKRRHIVCQLRTDVSTAFQNYFSAWNTWAGLLNRAFEECPAQEYHSLHIPILEKDIEKYTIQECMDEIRDAARQTSGTLDHIMEVMGVVPFLPSDWKEKGIKIDDLGSDTLLKIGKVISCVGSSVLAGYMGYHIFVGVTVVSALVASITQSIGFVGTLVGGLAGGLVLGGAVFLITDMISSAITGAIERKELNEAIDLLQKLKNEVAVPLNNSAFSIQAVCTDIKNKQFTLGNGYVLAGQPDGSYAIMKLQPIKAANNMCVQELRGNHEVIMFIPAPVA
ncbi:MAG: hypothetical protein IKB09_03160 [Oscillospiraceae bacterium]|nr:hypothetical protein [Oscillospiraceae bacterium]